MKVVELQQMILRQSKRAGTGHIGPALSIANIVGVLYSGVLKIEDPDAPDRDRFVLSKGHAALTLYCALRLKGWLTEEQLDSYGSDNTYLGVHPERALRGIDFTTGSLGHGLAYGVGAAMAARLDESDRRVYVLCSDAECDEGSLWEAALFAGHHGLGRLTAIIDVNGQQALGKTRDVLDLEPLVDKWRSFGWRVEDVDGHDDAALAHALEREADPPNKPRVVLAQTVSGKGVGFMEGKVVWHYQPLSDDDYDSAMAQVGAGASERPS